MSVQVADERAYEPSYEEIAATVTALIEGETDWIAVLSTVVAELHQSRARFHWTGFYRAVGETLRVGPYQGGHGCLFIPFSRGVCGHVARTGEPILVADVSAFADHIACSSKTVSEIVVPIHNRDRALVAVLDVDSDWEGALSEDDLSGLSVIARLVGGHPATPGNTP